MAGTTAKKTAAKKAPAKKTTSSSSSDKSKGTGDVSSTRGDEVTDAQKAVDQANTQKAESVAKLASDKKPEERSPAEIKAAAATAAAKIKQDEYDALQKVQDEAQEQANKNDDDSDDAYAKAAKITEDVIREKLQTGTTPAAVAKEHEDYVLKQNLYQQAGLSAPDVLATANAAEKVKA